MNPEFFVSEGQKARSKQKNEKPGHRLEAVQRHVVHDIGCSPDAL